MASHVQPQTHLPPRPGSEAAPTSPNPLLRLHILILWPHTQWPGQPFVWIPLAVTYERQAPKVQAELSSEHCSASPKEEPFGVRGWAGAHRAHETIETQSV